MVGHGGSSAGSYLADPTSPIPSHCASIVVTSTVRVNFYLIYDSCGYFHSIWALKMSKNHHESTLTRTISEAGNTHVQYWVHITFPYLPFWHLHQELNLSQSMAMYFHVKNLRLQHVQCLHALSQQIKFHKESRNPCSPCLVAGFSFISLCKKASNHHANLPR